MAKKPKQTSEQELAERWLNRIEKRCSDFETWWASASKVYSRYRNEEELVSTSSGKGTRGRRFNVLWSNIQVMKPAMYAKDPLPVVERKHKDRAEVGRLASQILERAILVCVQEGTFGDAMKMARDDRLLSSRGLVWLRYSPTFGEEKPQRIPVTKGENGAYFGAGKIRASGEVIEDDLGPFVPGDTYKPVVAETVGIEFVHHKDFVHSDAPSWDKVTWAARRVHMTKRQIADRFGGDIAALIETRRNDTANKTDKAPRDTSPIWEICDRDNGEWLWISPDHKDGPLDVKADPLNLSTFFPCPRPLYGTLTPDSLTPVTDWGEYSDQARELDLLTDRAYNLIEGIRVAGVYDANAPGLDALFNKTSGDKFVAVNNWAAFAERGGLKSAMDQIDIKPIADALQIILSVREQVKRDLYEISGISDLMRGDTNANETLGAQKLKASFGTSRVREPKDDMQRFVRDAIRIIAEIICEHFSPEQIADMADVADLLPEQFKSGDPAQQEQAMNMYMAAIQLLKDDGARGYKISIETDSTVELDEQQEKQDRIEFLTAATGFMEKAALVGQQEPAMKPLLASMLQWGMKAFRVSRDLEGEFEKAIEGMAQAEKQRQQQTPPPTPEQLKAKEAQDKIASDERVRVQEAQIKGQTDTLKVQADAQKAAQAHAEKMRQFELDFAELDAEAARHQRELAHQSQLQDRERTFKGEQSDKDRAMKLDAEAMKASAKDGGEGDTESEDEMKIELAPEIQQAIAQAVIQQKQVKAQSEQANAQMTQQLPQVMAEVAQSMGQAAQAMTQVAETLAQPVEIVKGPNGVKRTRRVREVA